VAFVIEGFAMSERQACKLLEVGGRSYRYEPLPRDDGRLREEMGSLASRNRVTGSGGWVCCWRALGRAAGRLRRTGPALFERQHGQSRVTGEPRLVRPAAPVAQLTRANQDWARDFVIDGLATGRGVRALTAVDEYKRECLAIGVDSCLSSRRVTRVLEWAIQQRGKPESLRCNTGPEFPSRHFLAQNGRVASFDGRLRDECLNGN
jgi:putative transposase